MLLVASAPPAIAQRRGATGHVLHEPIPVDAREDVALSVSLGGEIPAAINTPRGLVPAPDQTKPVGTGESPYGQTPRGDVPDTSFHPDRDTRRPDVLPYDEPFSPSTAPFKRLSAFDTVDAAYTLSVRDAHQSVLPLSPAPDATSEEQFYGDMVVDLAAGQRVRIPSVGPGTRVIRARAGVGTQDVRIQLYRDGADNWFVEAETTVRARLVMELSIPRAVFGGEFGTPSWAELLPVPPLAPNVQRSASEVASKIGVSRRLSPRDNVSKLVAYFRGFSESEEPTTSSRDIYLDLALSRKGVCRHRAFAFMVTSLSLGIPTRMIVNEAHAWVEVHDGRLWRRIDLGGAGRTLHDPLSSNVPHDPPPDPFAWPQGATRGDDLADRARHAPPPTPGQPGQPGQPGTSPATPAASGSASRVDDPTGPGGNGPGGGPGGIGPGGGPGGNGPGGPGGNGPGGNGPGGNGPGGRGAPDDRPASLVALTLSGGADARRGAPFKIRGQVSADGEPCAHLSVDIVLRGGGRTRGDLTVGQLATDAHGAFEGALVLPASVPLGEYEIQARTGGDGRCGVGFTR